jgi:predicted ATPase/DNA-binding CsgD family transcriptional regulator
MTDAPQSTLPHTFTPLIGRECDIEAISTLLQTTTGSIITLVGPAGVGKTRLAVAVAAAKESAFEQGAVYVDLATVTEPGQVLPVIVSALGLVDAESAASQLAQHLSTRSLLLVIDNFEQVIEAGPVLNACLAGAPRVRTLVTSQKPLRVWGEQEFSVEPLLVPPALPDGAFDADALVTIGAFPSVRLFVERAQSVRAGFQLTASNAPAVVAICRFLDGIPLAIELAAARSNVLSPEALLHRLSASLQLLSGGPRDAPDRHQTLRAAIEWTYGLLEPKEALLLDRLSVFAGSFSLQAVEAIAGNASITFAPSMYVSPNLSLPSGSADLDWTEIFELLDALVDHSLVRRVESAGQEPRFRLFQTIRQLAAAKLTARSEDHRTGWRHAAWYWALGESGWDAGGVSLLEQSWLSALEVDLDNVRAALDFLGEHDPAGATSMAASLIWFFYIRGRRMEGIRTIERTEGSFDPEALSPEARARIDFALGNLLALYPNTRDSGVARLEGVLDELRRLGHDWGAGYTLLALGALAEDAGNYARALEYIADARPLLEAVGDEITLANVDFHTAVSLFGLNRLDEARVLATKVAFATPDQAGLNIAYALHLVGMIDLVGGQHEDAARRFLDASEFSKANGVIATAAELLDATATLVETRGADELAARLFGAGDRHNQETGNPITYPERIQYDAARDRVRSALGAARFLELLTEGGTLSMDDAFALMHESLRGIFEEQPAPLPPFPVFGSTQPFGLTSRETEVLRLVAMGRSDREIAELLYISHGTARTHVRNILDKLDAPNRSAATSIALRERLVDLSETG